MKNASRKDVYARVGESVRAQPKLALRLGVSSVMHALGHGLVAAAAGACVKVLAGGSAVASTRTAPIFSGFADIVDARVIAAVGLFAVVIKVAAGAAAAHAEVSLAKAVGGAVRLELLTQWLRRHRLRAVGHGDQGGVPAPQLNAHPSAAVASATVHVADIEQGVVRGVIGRARAVCELAPLVALALFQNGKLALAAAIVSLPFVIASGRARKGLKKELAREGAEVDALARAADEAARHADVWTVFGAGARVRRAIVSLGESLRDRAAKVAVLSVVTSGANEILAALALVIVAFAARAHLFGLDDGALVPFMIVFFLAYKPLRALSEARFFVARAEVALDRANIDGAAIEDAPHEEDAPRARRWGTGPLVVRDVRACESVLSFEARIGEIVAIHGPTGSGKTTLLRALLGLGETNGTIAWGDERIERAAAGPDARPFSYAPQDAPIVSDSLAANVALAGDVDAAALLASMGAGAFVRDVGHQRLGPGGRALSGGEAKLVNVARAFASTAPVVLLDEPTAGLDADSRAALLAFVAREKAHRAIILVTHDPSAIVAADRAIAMNAPEGARPRAEPSRTRKNAINP